MSGAIMVQSFSPQNLILYQDQSLVPLLFRPHLDISIYIPYKYTQIKAESKIYTVFVN